MTNLDPSTSPADTGPGRALPGAVSAVLVEDHLLVREQLDRQLTEAGIEVLAAVGTVDLGRQAVDALHPDVAVLDNHLPDGLGIDLCARIKHEHPEVVVVIYSGHLRWEDTEQAMRAGADSAVPKSFDSRELIAAITQKTRGR